VRPSHYYQYLHICQPERHKRQICLCIAALGQSGPVGVFAALAPQAMTASHEGTHVLPLQRDQAADLDNASFLSFAKPQLDPATAHRYSVAVHEAAAMAVGAVLRALVADGFYAERDLAHALRLAAIAVTELPNSMVRPEMRPRMVLRVSVSYKTAACPAQS